MYHNNHFTGALREKTLTFGESPSIRVGRLFQSKQGLNHEKRFLLYAKSRRAEKSKKNGLRFFFNDVGRIRRLYRRENEGRTMGWHDRKRQ